MSIVTNAELVEARAKREYETAHSRDLAYSPDTNAASVAAAYRKYMAAIRLATTARRRAAGEHAKAGA